MRATKINSNADNQNFNFRYISYVLSSYTVYFKCDNSFIYELTGSARDKQTTGEKNFHLLNENHIFIHVIPRKKKKNYIQQFLI